MRLKFFIITLGVLLATTVSLTTLIVYHVQNERMDFIDGQIRETAAAVMDSKLSDLPALDYEKVDAIISEELGPDRIGKFFIIRNKSGEILYKSKGVNLLHVSFPTDPQWVTINYDRYIIRMVNLQLPRSQTRTLQVGVIAESNFLYWAIFKGSAGIFLIAIPAVFLLMTWILSASLFSPLRTVSDYVKEATQALEANKEVPKLPQELDTHLKEDLFLKDDEFRDLLKGIKGFAKKVNANSKFTRRWTHQMVHELKTPLTILNHDLEAITTKYSLADEDTLPMTQSLNRISRVITNFLDWAELTYQGQRLNLHVVKIASVLSNLVPSLEKVFKNRITVEIKNDFQVLSDPTHLEQVLSNLITNALKYSTEKVQIEVYNNFLYIKDQGPGLPATVIENLGSPFNKGPQGAQSDGSGLGLAWVQIVSDLYNWNLNIDSTSEGTVVSIHFPPIIES